MKYKQRKPVREQLFGMSASQFKTLLKLRGHTIGRDFFKTGSVSKYKGRLYRFRWWRQVGEFFVDVSCPIVDFDRWANSTDNVMTFYNWFEEVK